MTARRWAWVITGALIAYLLLAGWRGVVLMASGTVAGVGLGIAVLVIPTIGAWLVWREIDFGFAMQRMGEELAASGDLPVDDFTRTPSGRIVAEDAHRFLAVELARVEAHPQDWASWYRLGLALDAARDRRRARAAMREARRLHQ